MYLIDFHESARERLFRFDKSIRIRFYKKIDKMQVEPPGKHLKHGFPYFIEELGQYRIAYFCDEEKKSKLICFIGDHKEYEIWCREVMKMLHS